MTSYMCTQIWKIDHIRCEWLQFQYEFVSWVVTEAGKQNRCRHSDKCGAWLREIIRFIPLDECVPLNY